MTCNLFLKMALMVGFATVAPAATIALTFTPGTGSELTDSPTIGWEFSVFSTIQVTALGYYDVDNDGLADSHSVGIWTADGALVGSGVVASGTVDDLLDGFRYTPVSFTLTPGTYIIGADKLTGADSHVFGVTSFATASEIGYVRGRYTFDTGALNLPTESCNCQEPGYFGPNFQFEAASVPEPATGLLLPLCVGALYARRRYLRRSTLN